MLTFIHAADIHLDSPMQGLSRYEGAPEDLMRGATRRALENLVDYAVEEAVSLVVLSGDVYDGDWKDFQTGLFFSRQMARLKDAGVRVVLIRGNHDAQSSMTRHLPLPENVTELSTRKPGSAYFEDLHVAVHGQGYSRRDVTDNLAARYPQAMAGVFNIGLLHTALTGRSGHANYAPCSLDDLMALGYDYWALGHVHDFSVEHESPFVVFSGCTQGRNIRETGAKGCVRVDVSEDGEVDIEFVPLDVARFANVTVDATDVNNSLDVVEAFSAELDKALDEADGRALAVRATITGACAAHAEMTTNQEAFVNALRARAGDVSGERAWVEKVKIATATPLDIEALRGSDTPQGDLLRYLDELVDDADVYDELGVDLTKLTAKVGSAIELPDIEDVEVRRALMRDVREMVLPMFEGGEDA